MNQNVIINRLLSRLCAAVFPACCALEAAAIVFVFYFRVCSCRSRVVFLTRPSPACCLDALALSCRRFLSNRGKGVSVASTSDMYSAESGFANKYERSDSGQYTDIYENLNE